MKSNKRFYTLISMIFIVMNTLFVTTKARLQQWGFSQDVLLLGNLFLWLVTLLAYRLHTKAMQAKSTNEFLRYVYSAMFGKMMFCALVAVIYIFIARKEVNKPALFFCMFLYFLYSFIEIRSLLKFNQEKKNAG